MCLQCGSELAAVDPSHDLEAPRAVEHERHRAQRLLVAAHERDELVAVGIRGQPLGQLVRRHHGPVLLDTSGVDATEAVRDLGRVHESDADGLAVTEVVAARGLERVRQRVAVVQQRAPLGFALVVGDDCGLDLDAARDALVERAAPSGRHR